MRKILINHGLQCQLNYDFITGLHSLHSLTGDR